MDVDRVSSFQFCQRCKRDVFTMLVRDIFSNGSINVYWYCINGKHAAIINGRYIGHDQLRKDGYDPDRLPVINNYTGNELCVVCGSQAVEYHHWAPKYLFNSDAEKWPGNYLCIPHHTHWHNIVTPDMSVREK